MASSFLGICIGNTTTHVGVFNDGKLSAQTGLVNDAPETLPQKLREAASGLDDAGPVLAVLASVHPGMEKRVNHALAEQLRATVYRAERDLPIPIGRQLESEAIVGDDRLLNAAAAYDVLKQACVIVDAGTALTVDFVDAAGTYHGGAVAPGARMMLRALHEQTAQLPLIEWHRPSDAIGHDTAQAILSGVFHGMRGMVRELVEQYAEIASGYPMVVATGGDAECLFDGYDLIERIVPDLTLLGLGLTVRVAGENDLMIRG
jgi:type III pantothenate kinase